MELTTKQFIDKYTTDFNLAQVKHQLLIDLYFRMYQSSYNFPLEAEHIDRLALETMRFQEKNTYHIMNSLECFAQECKSLRAHFNKNEKNKTPLTQKDQEYIFNEFKRKGLERICEKNRLFFEPNMLTEETPYQDHIFNSDWLLDVDIDIDIDIDFLDSADLQNSTVPLSEKVFENYFNKVTNRFMIFLFEWVYLKDEEHSSEVQESFIVKAGHDSDYKWIVHTHALKRVVSDSSLYLNTDLLPLETELQSPELYFSYKSGYVCYEGMEDGIKFSMNIILDLFPAYYNTPILLPADIEGDEWLIVLQLLDILSMQGDTLQEQIENIELYESHFESISL